MNNTINNFYLYLFTKTKNNNKKTKKRLFFIFIWREQRTLYYMSCLHEWVCQPLKSILNAIHSATPPWRLLKRLKHLSQVFSFNVFIFVKLFFVWGVYHVIGGVYNRVYLKSNVLEIFPKNSYNDL